MGSPQIATLEKMLGTPRDGALLRFSLGNEYLKAGDLPRAVEHLRAAVEREPRYSAAWKVLARALESSGKESDALEAYRRGIAAAREKGDRQAEKEMGVFARRLEKRLRA